MGIAWRWWKARANFPAVTGSVSGAAAAQSHGEIFKSWRAIPIADAMVQFSGDDNHLFFKLGERLLLSRKLTGNFPDFERVLPKDHPHAVVR
jgi:hypothetical protein